MHIDFGIPTLVWSSVQLVSEQLNLCLTLCCTNSVFPQFLRHIPTIDSYRPPTHRLGHLSMIPYYFKVVFFTNFALGSRYAEKDYTNFRFYNLLFHEFYFLEILPKTCFYRLPTHRCGVNRNFFP